MAAKELYKDSNLPVESNPSYYDESEVSKQVQGSLKDPKLTIDDPITGRTGTKQTYKKQYVDTGQGAYLPSSDPKFSKSGKGFTGEDFAQNILRQSKGLSDTPWATDSAEFLAADVNKDGKLDMSDSIEHLRYSAGLEEPGQEYDYSSLAKGIKPGRNKGETDAEYVARTGWKKRAGTGSELLTQRDMTGPDTVGQQTVTVGDMADQDALTSKGATADSATAGKWNVYKGGNAGDVTGATGEVTKVIDPQTGLPTTVGFAERTAASALAQQGGTGTMYGQTGTAAGVGGVDSATAFKRDAYTGDNAERIAQEIVERPSIEAASRQAVTGTARTTAAASMIAQIGNMPEDISAAIGGDPVTVEAQLGTMPPDIIASVAALPVEALVSTQMENLLAGIEGGEIPVWARPAVEAVEKTLAARGLGRSSIGRDALLNSIIQSAIPIAQMNAQSLKERATQNLSNEQQATLQSASQQQQMAMQNLSNRQTSESQSAQYAAALQSQSLGNRQQATLQSAAQTQQTAMANLQNRQQAEAVSSQQDQQVIIANLSNEQQMELANLQSMNQADSESMTNEQQARLAEYQTATSFLAKNADLAQQMQLANLSTDQQMRLANLSALNQAGAEGLNVEQTAELATLENEMKVNLTTSQFAQQIGVAHLSNKQQAAVVNAQNLLQMDVLNLNNRQQTELANSQLMQSMSLANLSNEQQSTIQQAVMTATMNEADATRGQQAQITNAQNFLQMDMVNLSNAQQATMLQAQQVQQDMLSDQAADNASRQFNATQDTQVNTFMANLKTQVSTNNATRDDATKQFNTSLDQQREAIDTGNDMKTEQLDAQINSQIDEFNAQINFNKNQFNTQNQLAIEQSNAVWRRQLNTANTAGDNSVTQANAMNAFNMSNQALTLLWQEQRDAADWSTKMAMSDDDSKTRLGIAALGNEAAQDANKIDELKGLGNFAINLFNTWKGLDNTTTPTN